MKNKMMPCLPYYKDRQTCGIILFLFIAYCGM